MTATAEEPSVALVLVVNVQTLREKSFSIEMPHLVIAISLLTNQAPTCLQFPLKQWGADNVYLLVLSKAKR